ncbi:MAG TPA: hypothetical protein VF796_10650, partial [Humisphaera sp.]
MPALKTAPRTLLACALALFATASSAVAADAPKPATPPAAQPVAKQESPTGIKHGVLALGNATYILNSDGAVGWTYPA